MPNHFFRCLKCQRTYEEFVGQGVDSIECGACGWRAEKVWIQAPGFNGKSKGLYPRYDPQLGVTLESRQHEDRVVKQKGLIGLGPDEYRRTLNSAMTTETPEPKLEGLHDAMEEAYADLQKGVPAPEMKVIDTPPDMVVK